MKRALALVVVLGLAACGERVVVLPAPGSVLLHVDTDAPVPRSRAPGPLDAVPLFDRLRIQIYPPGAAAPCEGCTNEFALDDDLLRRGGASVGIAPLPGVAGYRVRVRVFPRRFTGQDGEPDPDVVLETIAELPPVADTGKLDVTVVLRTDDVGTKVGSLEAPVAAAAGAPASSLVGSWPSARRVDCRDAAPDGTVCVPGGAFWMGDRREPWAVLPGHDVTAPRLVVLAPFFLDATEVTAAAFRRDPKASAFASTGGAGEGITDFCTLAAGAAPGPREALPVNCVSWAAAEGYCRRRGGELPTEAQFEYVGSGLVGRSFPWGEDPPECEDAVYSRLGYGLFANSTTKCKPPEPFGGPVAPGQGARDRLVLKSGTIVDVAGNVAEWMRDRWHRKDEPCWSRPGVYVDPYCSPAQPLSIDGDKRTVRGGSWLVTGGQLSRTNRASAATTVFASPEVGFRCVLPAEPAE